MTDLLQKKAELTLIYSVPILSDAEENSRLAGLQRKLQKAVIPYMRNIVGFTDYDLEPMVNNILRWGRDTGWLNDKRHTSALISFCMDMIERSPFDYPEKIINILSDIADHLEQNNELDVADCMDGGTAAEKWEQLYIKEM